MTVIQLCQKAKQTNEYMLSLTSQQKNEMLKVISSSLIDNMSDILQANKQDLINGESLPVQMKDRLALNDKRIKDMSEGLVKLIDLPDPIGEVSDSFKTKTGLDIKKIRVPFGTIAIIYEARPNVTIDAIGLALKTSNSIVLRGSKDAIVSNTKLVNVVKKALSDNGYNPEFIQLIEDTSRESSSQLMKARGYVDVLIPRGSASLINAVVAQSTVPIIETGTGNCHAYVQSSADIDKAINIIINGKTQRPSVCNALESILIDEDVACKYLPLIYDALMEKGVTVKGCEKCRKICPAMFSCTEDDFYTEYLGLTISIKIVKDYHEAIRHINKYSTHHSEVIISNDKDAIKEFTHLVDSACVYVNASTRFTDGFEFGFGAEMGISTQKLHARGPMGLKQLCSEKYTIMGDGQIRQ